MIFKYLLCDCLKKLIKLLKAGSKANPRTNIWSKICSEPRNTKDLKTQCCYNKEISYEAVSSRKFDTHDDSFLVLLNGSSTKKEFSTNEI